MGNDRNSIPVVNKILCCEKNGRNILLRLHRSLESRVIEDYVQKLQKGLC